MAFCLAASSVYLINDARDVEADRQHPTKRFRPIAAGVVPEWLAYTLAVVLGVASLAISWLATPNLAVVMAVYIAIQLAYCFGLKHQAVLDICIVSSGFLIRAIAGGVAAGIPLSQWFLLVMAFGSLFMAAGKRYAELQLAERTGAKIRKSLESYTSTYLRFVWTLSATAMVVCYGLWAFERDGRRRVVVRGVDDPVHRRDPALRRRRRRRHGGRARGDRAAATGCCSCWPLALDRNRRCRRLPQLTGTATAADRCRRLRAVRPAGRRFPMTSRSGSACGSSVLVVAVLFGWGAWQRRWIADDGLIVLRTVRNLLAGNGPVFNEGERVEANTSTVWTYLIYLGGWVGGPVRLEYVALVLALVLSVLGVVLAMLGAGRLYAPSLQGRRALLLPAGALVYIAVPPARDFATSGLENGLVLAYLGPAVVDDGLLVAGAAPSVARQARPSDPVGGGFDAALAFVAGLSVLVRPELALIGGLALVMMLIAARGWRRRAADRGGGWPAAGRLPDLPDGLLRLAGARNGGGQGRLGRQVAAGFRLSGQLQQALSAVGARGAAAGAGGVLLVTRGRPWWMRLRSRRATGGWPAPCRARPP